jgi:hypothetical protein
MTAITIMDAYTDKPRTPRAQPEEHIRQLMCASWADPGDREVREQAALQALDRTNGGTAS